MKHNDHSHVAYVIGLSPANLSFCEHVRVHHRMPIDCQMLPLAVAPPPAQHQCTAALGVNRISSLRAGTVYLVDPAKCLSNGSLASIHGIISDIGIRDSHTSSDSAARTQYFGEQGSWYRFVLDEIMLPLGVHQALYLDVDALMQADVTAIWQAADMHLDAPAIVAARASNDSWWRKEYHGVRPAALRKWGLVPKRTFNNGVMLINLETWCKINAFQRMAAVARHHAQVSAAPVQLALVLQ